VRKNKVILETIQFLLCRKHIDCDCDWCQVFEDTEKKLEKAVSCEGEKAGAMFASCIHQYGDVLKKLKENPEASISFRYGMLLGVICGLAIRNAPEDGLTESLVETKKQYSMLMANKASMHSGKTLN